MLSISSDLMPGTQGRWLSTLGLTFLGYRPNSLFSPGCGFVHSAACSLAFWYNFTFPFLPSDPHLRAFVFNPTSAPAPQHSHHPHAVLLHPHVYLLSLHAAWTSDPFNLTPPQAKSRAVLGSSYSRIRSTTSGPGPLLCLPCTHSSWKQPSPDLPFSPPLSRSIVLQNPLTTLTTPERSTSE
jgi:hypothetical protein